MRRRAGGAGLVVALFVLMTVGATSPAQAGAPRPVRDVTVDQAADLVRQCRSHVTVVLLYRSTCPACRDTLPDFIRAADSYRRRGVRILALSTDPSRAQLEHYLADNRLPFERLRLQQWQTGELTRALSTAGITIGRTFRIPHFVVLDRRGRVKAQWTGGGPRSVERMKAALDALL